MKTKKILIVENEAIIGHGMKATLEQKGYYVMGIASSKQEALNFIKANEPDLILMDIGIDGPADGISTAKTIRKTHDNIPIVFITQYNDEDIFSNATEVFPKNYITKPFSDETLFHTVALALLEVQSKQAKHIDTYECVFILSDDNQYKKLHINNILYIEAVRSYSRIHYINNNEHLIFLVSISSNNVASQLNSSAILQVHKSYYVNLDNIDYIKESHIYLKDFKDPLPIGRVYKEQLYKRINILRSGTIRKK